RGRGQLDGGLEGLARQVQVTAEQRGQAVEVGGVRARRLELTEEGGRTEGLLLGPEREAELDPLDVQIGRLRVATQALVQGVHGRGVVLLEDLRARDQQQRR